jgi:hypothetical protein
MSRLYLVCAICERRQADGLISGAAWGRTELPPGTAIEHPAVKESKLLTCPSCKERDPAWERAAFNAVGLNGSTPSAA